ncbi:MULTISPECIES: hypothetical protein [Staphylococcus]|uniref:hypothetical protein n=1 Tax=Staphylococcus TaxID=1279 RepID=UPI000D1B4C22|nr:MULTISPECIES: hypothetical protein [Staphylococcus]PTG39281.1 hypothetical protein BUY24_11145 [Staphylococcus cohnii]MDU9348551.1 hypothetical protein [Staphylococcus ureilyticus]PTG49864.1 hypothetical protein BUY26_00605 [Staphylococcus cohnii]QQV52890.1 hypothetical protein JG554_12685 [Staphylococcus sp. 11-B-312]RIL82610.1 hypothetical protein BUY33_11970 [Staphylococcus cohnii]
MSLPVAIILGIIIIPIYAYFWASIYRWENNRRVRRNNFKPMTKKLFYWNLLVHGIFAAIFVIIAIYLSYFN